MLHYHIHTIPHDKQRYPTVGDYWEEGVHTEVRVSATPDARYEFLVMIHELVEDFLCKQRGIPEPVVKAFDEAYEAIRPEGDVSEPGHDPSAPYHKEHVFAEKIEKQIATELGVDWYAYEEVINAL